MSESYTHCENAWSDTTIVRYLVTDNGSFGNAHDKPDIAFDTTDFYLGFVSSKSFADTIIIVISEWLNADGCSFTVVGYLLMRYVYAMNLLKCFSGFV